MRIRCDARWRKAEGMLPNYIASASLLNRIPKQIMQHAGLPLDWRSGVSTRLTTRWHLLQLSIFGLGALFFGVAGGCVLSVFTYGRGRGPFWRGATTSSENSSENVESDRNSSI